MLLRPRRRCAAGCGAFFHMYPKRLSATDISALASMKNVAKCDTWCELQNPVNHRVFERKLRPKPLGRGHVCLGVTHRCPTPPPQTKAGALGCGRRLASRALTARGWPKSESSATEAAAIGGETKASRAPAARPVSEWGLCGPEAPRKRRSHCDPRSGGTTR